MREISVLGISMRDLSLREGLRECDGFMKSGSLSTICFLNTDLLMKAKDDDALRDAIQGMDMLVAGSTDILLSGGVTARSRIKEVKGNFFLRELLKRFAREKKKIFIIGNSDDELVLMREKLLQFASGITFFGSFIYGENEVSGDAIINAVNSVLPDVIISLVESPAQELLMEHSRMMVNSRVWIALRPETLDNTGGGRQAGSRLLRFIESRIFKRTVKKFDESE